jgi:Ala-tRNA(Pro) deacylase
MDKEVFKILNENDIKYDVVEHPAVFTVEEALELVPEIDGIGCKNLFLKDNNKVYYIYVLLENKRADFESLSNVLGVEKVKFASEKELNDKTKLIRGSVTPLGIINNEEKDVIVLLDKELLNKKVLMHPNINTKTLSMSFEDLIKVIDSVKGKYKIV